MKYVRESKHSSDRGETSEIFGSVPDGILPNAG